MIMKRKIKSKQNHDKVRKRNDCHCAAEFRFLGQSKKLCPKCISTSGMKCLIAVLLAAIGVTSACKFIRVNNVTYAHEPQEYLPEGLKIPHPTGSSLRSVVVPPLIWM